MRPVKTWILCAVLAWTAAPLHAQTLGVLSTPIATPDGGLYGDTITVTLTSPEGAAIRYTVDGTPPGETSPLYTAPLTFGEGTTPLRARAFLQGWTPSAILTSVYTVDLTPPSISAQVVPSALPTGWHNTDVTITFTCTDALSGVAECPAPAVVTQEGIGQLVTGTATDLVGHQASTSVTINLDRTAGDVVLTSPTDGFTTTATSVPVTGQASDTLSGIVSATCNGAAATVVGGSVECTVDLAPGRNSIVLVARDAAGNGASSGVRVTRVGPASALRIDPGHRTLVVGESQPLTVIDEYGQLMPSATWTSSDPSIVTVTVAGGPAPPISDQGAEHQSARGAEASAKGLATAAAARARTHGNSTQSPVSGDAGTAGAALVTAVGVGTVTITAAADGLLAEATVTVLADASPPLDTTRWTVAPTPGFVLRPFYTHRADETVPDVFAAEIDPNEPNGAAVLVRGLTASGDSLWTEASPGTPIYGDSFGGLVAEVRDVFGGTRALARFAGPATAPPWRYESAGYTGAGAQAADGTIYTIEFLPGKDINGFFIYDVESGLRTSFRSAAEGETEAVSLRKAELPPVQGEPVAGGVSPLPLPVPPHGIIEGGVIFFSTATNILSSNEGYLKVALHEIGHLLGLGDNDGTGGSSVMNKFGRNFNLPPPLGRRDDAGRYVATVVRPCDRRKAKEAAARLWP